MFEQPRVLEEQLRNCLREQYNLIPATVEVLHLGLDYNAQVYRVMSKSGNAHFVKVKSGNLYEPSYYVPRFLFNQGITSVVAPIPTTSNQLYARLDKHIVLVYPFIDGDSSWAGMTDEYWKRVGNTFSQIHQVAHSDVCDFLRRESFDTTQYVSWIRDFHLQHIQVQTGGSDIECILRSAWVAHQFTINEAIDSLVKLACILQKQTLPFVICHADLHPANILRDCAGNVFISDWDEVMLAPKERDFIFLTEESFYGLTNDNITPFLHGYGPTEINWTVLTYYKLERAIQDLVAYTEEVFFKEDSLGDKTKANAIQAFIGILEEGGEISAAYSSAKHLPSDIAII